GRACACGRSTSTPPCIIGAVIMKTMSSTIITSTSEVTLISALRGRSPLPPPIPPMPPTAILDQSFAGHRADQLVGKSLELPGEEPHPVHEDVVAHDGGNGGREAGKSGHQRLRHTRRHRREVPRPARRDAGEGVDDADGSAEQAQQRTDRSDGGKPWDVMAEEVPLRRHFLPQDHLEGFELGRGEGLAGGFAPERAGTELVIEVERLAEEPLVGRRRQLHDALIRILQAGAPLHGIEEAVRLAVEAAELPPLESDDEP